MHVTRIGALADSFTRVFSLHTHLCGSTVRQSLVVAPRGVAHE